MGDLAPEDATLDARFVACLWPLGRAGWPDGGRKGREEGEVTLVAPAERLADVLAMAGLGIRLAGAAPFAEVVVVSARDRSGEVGADLDVAGLVASDGRPGVRVALLCGSLDLEAARELAARLDVVPAGDVDVDRLEEAVRAALDAGLPATALGLLAAALAAGVPAGSAPRARALASPFVGG